MIYKFTFEICNDDNTLLASKSEESGNFWWCFTAFMQYLMSYAIQNRLDRP